MSRARRLSGSSRSAFSRRCKVEATAKLTWSAAWTRFLQAIPLRGVGLAYSLHLAWRPVQSSHGISVPSRVQAGMNQKREIDHQNKDNERHYKPVRCPPCHFRLSPEASSRTTRRGWRTTRSGTQSIGGLCGRRSWPVMSRIQRQFALLACLFRCARIIFCTPV